MQTQQVSSSDVAMIEGFEIGSQADFKTSPQWPGGASGITIGVGYDLGYHTAKEISNDWSMLPRGTLVRLQSYAGRTGVAAQQQIFQTSDISVPYDAAKLVFENFDIPRATALTLGAFPGCEDLSQDSFGMLVSLVFNRGASMTDTTPGSRLEMRQIRDAIQSGAYSLVPGYFKAMCRLWVGKNMPGLITRRYAEAAQFQAGLINTPDVVTAATPDDADSLNDAELARLQTS